LAAAAATAAPEPLPSSDSRGAGFDPAGLLHQLRQDSIFSSPAGTNTSVLDQEQLVQAALEELKKARADDMPE